MAFGELGIAWPFVLLARDWFGFFLTSLLHLDTTAQDDAPWRSARVHSHVERFLVPRGAQSYKYPLPGILRSSSSTKYFIRRSVSCTV